MAGRYLTPTGQTSRFMPTRRRVTKAPEEPGISPIDIATTAIPAGTSSIKLYNTVQNKKLEQSQLLGNKSFRFSIGDDEYDDMFIPKVDQGFIEGFTNKWSKRLKLNPEYLKNKLKGLRESPTYTPMSDDLKHKDWIVANKDYNNWVQERNDLVKDSFSELKGKLKDRDISDKDINNILYGEQPGKISGAPSRPIIPVESEGEVFGDIDERMLRLQKLEETGAGVFDEYGGYEKWKEFKDFENYPTADAIESALLKGLKEPLPKGGPMIADLAQYSDAPIKRPSYITPDADLKEKGLFGKPGTGEGFFRNIGKGSVKDVWGGSKPGQVIKALKNIGKGGFKDLASGSKVGQIAKGIGQMGKGGLKSLFAAGTPATATSAATAAGPLAAMGPAGWTMLALSLLGPKLFKPHTAMGKIMGIFSDPRLKENIKRVGTSPSGVNVYEFNYKEVEGTYRGVLADEVPWASSKDKHGHKMVDYSQIDVDFIRVK